MLSLSTESTIAASVVVGVSRRLVVSVGDVSGKCGEDCNCGIFGNPYMSATSGLGISYPWALNG